MVLLLWWLLSVNKKLHISWTAATLGLILGLECRGFSQGLCFTISLWQALHSCITAWVSLYTIALQIQTAVVCFGVRHVGVVAGKVLCSPCPALVLIGPCVLGLNSGSFSVLLSSSHCNQNLPCGCESSRVRLIFLSFLQW